MTRALPRPAVVVELAALAVPAAVLFAMAYDNGAYSLPSRNFWAIAIWWAVLLVGALRSSSDERSVGLPVLAVGGLLAAFALLTVASTAWGSSAERAVNEFNRVSLYLGIFALTALFAGRRARWCDSLAIGICTVAAVSLLSRFAPDAFSDRGLAQVLPGAAKRLSFPVGYWNGLAILAALAVPLLLRAAAARGHVAIRAGAVAALPAIAAVIYLASSRGGYATLAVGALVFLVLSPDRWWPATALAVGGAGAVVAVSVIAGQSAFVNQPTSELGRNESTTALLALLIACLGAGAVYALAISLTHGRAAPSRTAGIATAVVATAVLIAAIAAVDPVDRFHSFKRPPVEAAAPTDDFVRSHLLSANGSGRWQFWGSAVDAFTGDPLLGRGAGSYEAWWAEHGTLALFVRDAHSLYLEVAAELGIVGLVLLLGAFSVGVVTPLSRLPALPRAEGRDLAACVAVFCAFAVAAAVDWMWELTAVTAVAFAVLALMVASPGGSRGREPRLRARSSLLLAGLAAAWFVICIQAVPYLSELRIRASQEAAAREEGDTALEAAESARAIQPWAASPWLQLALVREELGDLRSAERAIVQAREKDPTDWRLWLVSARLETKLGRIGAARVSLNRARDLNPRSPLFHGS